MWASDCQKTYLEQQTRNEGLFQIPKKTNAQNCMEYWSFRHWRSHQGRGGRGQALFYGWAQSWDLRKTVEIFSGWGWGWVERIIGTESNSLTIWVNFSFRRECLMRTTYFGTLATPPDSGDLSWPTPRFPRGCVSLCRDGVNDIFSYLNYSTYIGTNFHCCSSTAHASLRLIAIYAC